MSMRRTNIQWKQLNKMTNVHSLAQTKRDGNILRVRPLGREKCKKQLSGYKRPPVVTTQAGKHRHVIEKQ